MLEFELKWFLILTVQFLALVFILRAILFKPMLALFKERKQTVQGSMEAAKDMSQRRDSALDEMKKGFADAAHKARAEFESLRNTGLANQKEAVTKTSDEALQLISQARTALKAEADKARTSLRADVDKFSDEIVRKLTNV